MGDEMGKTYGAGKKAEDLGIRQVVLDEICQLAEQYGVEKVLLFGSRARGDFWRASDIDLAVVGGDVLNFALDVDEKTETLLEYDIVDLGEPVARGFAETIEREGIVLYEKV